MGIAEPDVTLTDYGLAIECAWLAAFLLRTPTRAAPLRFYFVAFFCAVGLAALLGGTEHGFLLDDTTLLHRVVWKGTLVAIGGSALAAWFAGAELIAAAPARWIKAGAVVLFVGYVVAVARSDAFLVAIVHYLPAVVFLLTVFVLGQFLLSREISGKDEVLTRLNSQINELTQLLALEKSGKQDLEDSLANLQAFG